MEAIVTKRPKKLKDLPETVPLFPLAGALLLPGLQRPLQIFEQRYVNLVDHVLGGNRLVGLIQPENADEESPQGRDVPLRRVGALGYLSQFEELSDARYIISLEGICRFDLADELNVDTSFRQGKINASAYAADFQPATGENAVDRTRFISMMQNYADFAELDFDWDEIEQTTTADLVNMCCMLSPYGAAEKQVLLEAASLRERAETLIALAELEMAHAASGTVLQ